VRVANLYGVKELSPHKTNWGEKKKKRGRKREERNAKEVKGGKEGIRKDAELVFSN